MAVRSSVRRVLIISFFVILFVFMMCNVFIVVVVIISDAKIGIYICTPNNLPIFFSWHAIFSAFHAAQHIIVHP